MPQEARRRDRLVGLFALGVILFNPPLLVLFGSAELLGWPLLFVYLFVAWGFLIAMVALTVERGRYAARKRGDTL